MPIQLWDRYRRADLIANPEWLFAFGDNLEGSGYGGQAREARGEPNAVGIPTKVAPSMNADDFFRDDDIARVFPLWRRAFERLNQHLLAGGVVVWPSDGVGTGRAELQHRAPELWRELNLFIAGMEATAAAVTPDAKKPA